MKALARFLANAMRRIMAHPSFTSVRAPNASRSRARALFTSRQNPQLIRNADHECKGRMHFVEVDQSEASRGDENGRPPAPSLGEPGLESNTARTVAGERRGS